MPIILLLLLGGAIGGIAYGADQKDKREREVAEFRRVLAIKEAQLRDLEVRYGRMSEQFRALAAEVARLRQLAAA